MSAITPPVSGSIAHQMSYVSPSWKLMSSNWTPRKPWALDETFIIRAPLGRVSMMRFVNKKWPRWLLSGLASARRHLANIQEYALRDKLGIVTIYFLERSQHSGVVEETVNRRIKSRYLSCCFLHRVEIGQVHEDPLHGGIAARALRHIVYGLLQTMRSEPDTVHRLRF